MDGGDIKFGLQIRIDGGDIKFGLQIRIDGDCKSELTGKIISMRGACFLFFYVPLCREISVYTGYNLMI